MHPVTLFSLSEPVYTFETSGLHARFSNSSPYAKPQNNQECTVQKHNNSQQKQAIDAHSLVIRSMIVLITTLCLSFAEFVFNVNVRPGCLTFSSNNFSNSSRNLCKDKVPLVSFIRSAERSAFQ